MPVVDRRHAIEQRMSNYLAKLSAPVADRIADRVADRLAEERISQLTTAEVERDDEYLSDSVEGRRELAESGLPPAWDDVRQELGLGDPHTHEARS